MTKPFETGVLDIGIIWLLPMNAKMFLYKMPETKYVSLHDLMMFLQKHLQVPSCDIYWNVFAIDVC